VLTSPRQYARHDKPGSDFALSIILSVDRIMSVELGGVLFQHWSAGKSLGYVFVDFAQSSEASSRVVNTKPFTSLTVRSSNSASELIMGKTSLLFHS
jgi:hypothetical protein